MQAENLKKINKLVEKKRKVLDRLKEIKVENTFVDFEPYPFQQKFIEAGKEYRLRNLMAANQIGKTRGTGYEMALHLTGEYPKDWKGFRFTGPITAWGLGVSNEQLHDVMQRHLFGNLHKGSDIFEAHENVSPFINQKYIKSIERNNQISGLVKNVYIKHKSGGTSTFSMKGYEQGQAKLMGNVVDLAWIDEEPRDGKIITQVLTRLINGNNKKGGLFLFTFTPELGMTTRVIYLTRDRSPTEYFQNATWDDAPHISSERRHEILMAYPEHERDMRSKGIPVRGEGRVFTVNEDTFTYKKSLFRNGIPRHWPQLVGHDFGWTHPQAWSWMAWDRDNDIIYVHKVLRLKNVKPSTMAGYMHKHGFQWIPIAWPHDGNKTESMGEQIVVQYKDYGLNMMDERATFPNGSNSVESGLMEMAERLEQGNMKICEDCLEWFEEYRNYFRKDGKIVKLDDDLMDSTRYGMMMIRNARTQALDNAPRKMGGLKQKGWY